MNEKQFSIHDNGYFGISLLDMDENAGKLISRTVNYMVERQNGIVFTDAQTSYDFTHKALSVEGVASNLTNESVAINGLIDCAYAVRGL